MARSEVRNNKELGSEAGFRCEHHCNVDCYGALLNTPKKRKDCNTGVAHWHCIRLGSW